MKTITRIGNISSIQGFAQLIVTEPLLTFLKQMPWPFGHVHGLVQALYFVKFQMGQD